MVGELKARQCAWIAGRTDVIRETVIDMVNVAFDYEEVQRRMPIADEAELRAIVIRLADHVDRRRATLRKLDPIADPYPEPLSDAARQAATGGAGGVELLRSLARDVWSGLNRINAQIGRFTP